MNESERPPQKAMASDVVTVGTNEEFIEDVFGAVEFEFTERFGQKWTPEVQELFQSSLETCRTVAKHLDAGATNRSVASRAARGIVRRLSNRSR